MKIQQKRTKCERYSRVVGYLRPVEQWNAGKQAEWEDRITFNVNISLKSKKTPPEGSKTQNKGVVEKE